ncbi:OmpH family outer membrane protein [soil metagenome]
MKKSFLLFVFAFGALYTNAQRYAIVDTRYILTKLPAYTQAQQRLDSFSVQWQHEIDVMAADVQRMTNLFDAEQVMLSDELKRKRQIEINNKETELRGLQKRRFGFEGDIFKKRQELIKPIQDRVYAAIQKVAATKMYDFILDKSEGITVIFADPKLDHSDDVLRELGVK